MASEGHDAKSRQDTIIIFLVLSAIDIAFNAAAGPAAVAAGAHVNGSPLTARSLQLGAVSGATKAGLLAFVGFLGFANLNIAASLMFILVASVFGVSVLITAQVSNAIWGDDTPSQLLIAAVVAALPLQWEGVGMYLASSHFRDRNPATGKVTNNFCPLSIITTWAYLVGWDALGGYTFARMAENQNFPICSLSAAAAAGAVFGVLSGIPKQIQYLTWGCFYNHTERRG